jgi:N6-L-threonylcarbamoyladenine synthase|tara:strand:+ start:681 stop:1661 length:981 start_codon:yes stop_codon:yes gene_type:complete
MICLGIESTAHTFGVGIVTDKGKVLANVIDAFKTEKGGLIPHELGVHHEEVKDKVLQDALEKANIELKDIDLVSFSQGPGIAPALLVGMRLAKDISKKNKIPIVGVNHCVAHLEIGKFLEKAHDPVLLYASGANTQIIAYEAGKYRIFGETLDQGIGNFIDAFGRYIGLGFPGGPKIEKIALKGKNYVQLPYVVKGMDVSFSGILTDLKKKFDSKEYKLGDLCFSLQETVFAMLIEVSERAMAHTGKKELLLGGGVACNKRLREMCNIMCKERNAKLFVPENQFLVDNAAMIAWLGILMKKNATKKYNTLDISPYERTDDVKVNWK